MKTSKTITAALLIASIVACQPATAQIPVIQPAIDWVKTKAAKAKAAKAEQQRIAACQANVRKRSALERWTADQFEAQMDLCKPKGRK